MASTVPAVPLLIPAEGPETMIPGLDDAKTTEMSARLDDGIGVAAVTYLLFGVKLGPALALSLVLVFALWIGWRWLCSKYPSTA
jgi:hypothetical protein